MTKAEEVTREAICLLLSLPPPQVDSIGMTPAAWQRLFDIKPNAAGMLSMEQIRRAIRGG